MKPDESRTVYDGNLVDVTLERWGEHEREIVEHPGAVAVVAVDRDERVTLVRQLREPALKELLELPAGTLEEGEEPLATARRELEEETGQSGGEWRELAAFYTTPGFCRERMHLFLAEGVESGQARQEADEEIELVAVPVAELRSLVRDLEDAKTIAGLLLYLEERERAAEGAPLRFGRLAAAGAPRPTTRFRAYRRNRDVSVTVRAETVAR